MYASRDSIVLAVHFNLIDASMAKQFRIYINNKYGSWIPAILKGVHAVQ